MIGGGGGARQTGYGQPVAVGRFRCVSRESGVRCENTLTRHGFELSRESHRMF